MLQWYRKVFLQHFVFHAGSMVVVDPGSADDEKGRIIEVEEQIEFDCWLLIKKRERIESLWESV